MKLRHLTDFKTNYSSHNKKNLRYAININKELNCNCVWEERKGLSGNLENLTQFCKIQTDKV